MKGPTEMIIKKNWFCSSQRDWGFDMEMYSRTEL